MKIEFTSEQLAHIIDALEEKRKGLWRTAADLTEIIEYCVTEQTREAIDLSKKENAPIIQELIRKAGEALNINELEEVIGTAERQFGLDFDAYYEASRHWRKNFRSQQPMPDQFRKSVVLILSGEGCEVTSK